VSGSLLSSSGVTADVDACGKITLTVVPVSVDSMDKEPRMAEAVLAYS
jgi:hypothetical protein